MPVADSLRTSISPAEGRFHAMTTAVARGAGSLPHACRRTVI
jgi:hypothetical protein